MSAWNSQTRLTNTHAKGIAFWRALTVRDFRLLWFGETISILGDQFYIVALPWLIFELTGSALALGSVLLAATVPRLIFQLVGGALSDRVSRYKLLFFSHVVRFAICVMLTALVLLNAIRIWQLFVFAIIFGIVDAFYYPALRAFIPALLETDKLAAGNSLLQGTGMTARFMGPLLAGFLIAGAGTSYAFGIDAISFFCAAMCLLSMRRRMVLRQSQMRPPVGSDESGLFTSIVEGIRYTFSVPELRTYILIISVIEFCFAGPFSVGLASLATSRFVGSTALGTMLSTLGAGLLLGTLLAGWLSISNNHLRLMITLAGTMAIGLMLIGVVSELLYACLLILLIGTIGGYLQILNTVFLQVRSDPQMRGRVLSIVILSAYGLTPLSYFVTGALTKISSTLAFVVSGSILLIAMPLCAWSQREKKLVEAASPAK